MSEFTEEQMVAFHNTYMTMSEDLDKHTLFAYKLGIDRQEAKRLCYKILWNIPFMKPMMQDLIVLDNIRKVMDVDSTLSG